jgi:hypothetical protein
MYSKISQNTFYKPSRSPLIISSTRSISNSKQITLPSLTPHKSFSPISQGKSFFPNIKKPIQAELSQKFEKIMKEKQKYSNIVKNLRIKLQQVEHLKETYGLEIPKNFQVTPKNLKKLENTAIMQKKTLILSSSVRKIETWWKKRMIKRKIEDFNRKLENSAVVIQKCWKQFITRKKFMKAVVEMNRAALKIQKFFRGYLTRKQFSLLIRERRMSKVFEYFDQQKLKILQESAKKIWNFWQIVRKKWKVKQQQKKKQMKKVMKKKRKAEENNSFAAFPVLGC